MAACRELSATVVICTHSSDRWDDLLLGLSALETQTVLPDRVLVVVDRNPDLMARLARERPETEVVANTESGGVSGARNTGIARAGGDVVVFLDDDARPDPTWLELMLAPFADPRVQIVGGRAEPVWPRDRPDHVVPELDWLVGCTHRGVPTQRSVVRNPIGASMALRRDLVDQVGGFHDGVSRSGSLPLGCDDTEFAIRVVRARPDSLVVYEPAAVVHHRVGAERTTWSYLRRRSRAEGLSKATVAALAGQHAATSVERVYVRRVLPAAVVRELGRGLRGDRAGWSGVAGVVVSLALTTYGYVTGSLTGPVRALRRGA
jgi:glucosyl-dolichyl phosphate glucuronosyltransferase